MDNIFNFFISIFASIISFIVVVLLIGGVLLLPLLFNYGWLMYIPLGLFIIGSIVCVIDNEDKKNKEQ